MCPIWLRESGAVRALIDRAVQVTREQAAIGLLPYLLSHLAIDQATTDRPAAAVASFYEVIQLARETRLWAKDGPLGCTSEVGLGSRPAWGGMSTAAHTHVEALDLARDLGLGLCEIWATAALGELNLGIGRPNKKRLPPLNCNLDPRGPRDGDVDLSPGPELVELYVRTGRREVALGRPTTKRGPAQGPALGSRPCGTGPSGRIGRGPDGGTL